MKKRILVILTIAIVVVLAVALCACDLFNNGGNNNGNGGNGGNSGSNEGGNGGSNEGGNGGNSGNGGNGGNSGSNEGGNGGSNEGGNEGGNNETPVETHITGKISYSDSVYEGQVLVEDQSVRDGYGVLKALDGSILYQGYWKQNKKDGTGKYSWPSGAWYDGDWKEDKMDGKGTYHFANNEEYKGDFVANAFTGEAEYYNYANGNVYSGAILNGVPNGAGRMAYKSGDVYEGNFANGKRDGQGKMTYASGDSFDGQWVEGAIGDSGEYIWGGTAGVLAKYNGAFVSGAPKGVGTVTYRNGDTYRGNVITYNGSLCTPHDDTGTAVRKYYKDGKLSVEFTGTWNAGTSESGTAKYYDADGNHNETYVGGFVGGRPLGKGVLSYLTSGDSFDGVWDSEGNWKNGGTYTWGNNATLASYTGQYQNGLPNGTGLVVYKEEGVSYNGELVSSSTMLCLPNGLGKMVYGKDAQGNDSYYDGRWVNGVQQTAADEIATYHYTNGDEYVGEWELGKQQGDGLMTYASGNYVSYNGSWFGDKYDGQGVLTLRNGDVRSGQWSQNKQISGFYTWANGDQYNGYFDDNGNGETRLGIFIWANGDRYEGPVHQGIITTAQNEEGSIYYATGDRFTGTWSEGHKTNGSYIESATGNTFFGDFQVVDNVDYMKSGVYSWKSGADNGNKYTGSYRVVKDEHGVVQVYKHTEEGTATFEWANGSKYVGEYKNDLRSGSGNMTYCDNTGKKIEYYAGLWSGDKRNDSTTKKSKTDLYAANGIDVIASYVGGWKDDKYDDDSGNAKYTIVGEGYFTAVFVAGEIAGNVDMALDSGAHYVGGFVNGKQEGYGEMTYANEDVYKGNWNAGNRHDGSGDATFEMANGDKFEGKWANDYMADGAYTWANGDKYVGAYAVVGEGNAKQAVRQTESGKTATWTWANGDKYVGEFVGGDIQGEGTYTFKKKEGDANSDALYSASFDGAQNAIAAVYTFGDGSKIYRGDYVDGKFVDADATMEFYAGAKLTRSFTGAFVDGESTTGDVNLYDEDGAVIAAYHGDFVAGKRVGDGWIEYFDNSGAEPVVVRVSGKNLFKTVNGEWVNDHITQGSDIYYEDGVATDVYLGTFQIGPDGADYVLNGTYEWRSKREQYTGGFVVVEDGGDYKVVKQGSGTLCAYYETGKLKTKYTGAFDNDQPHGMGTYIEYEEDGETEKSNTGLVEWNHGAQV